MTQTTDRTTTDLAVLAAIAEMDPCEAVEKTNDGLKVEILENSGLIAVSYLSPVALRKFDPSPLKMWESGTKLSTGESIAHTDEGRSYLARYAANECWR
jgi:hypothetical protein